MPKTVAGQTPATRTTEPSSDAMGGRLVSWRVRPMSSFRGSSGLASVSYDGETAYEVTFKQDDLCLGNRSWGSFSSSAEADAGLAAARTQALRDCTADSPRFECHEGCLLLDRPGRCEVTAESVSLAAENPPDANNVWSCVLCFEVTAEATDRAVYL